MAYDIKRLPSEASVDHDHEASLHDIKISGITKSFYNNGEMRQVLRPVDILIPHGKFVSIIGPSGCGKSTLFWRDFCRRHREILRLEKKAF